VLPPALESPCIFTLAVGRGSTCGLDRIGGRTELMSGDVCDRRSLASSVRGMACCPAQISGRGHCTAGRRARLGHGDLAARPGPPEFDRATRSRVLRLCRLEEVKDVLRTRYRPQSLRLLRAFLDEPLLVRAYREAVAAQYLWHEFGDLCLIL